MSVDMSPAAVSARLLAVSAMADLRPERRLDTKVDMSPSGVSHRLAEVARLCALCRALGQARPTG